MIRNFPIYIGDMVKDQLGLFLISKTQKNPSLSKGKKSA